MQYIINNKNVLLYFLSNLFVILDPNIVGAVRVERGGLIKHVGIDGKMKVNGILGPTRLVCFHL